MLVQEDAGRVEALLRRLNPLADVRRTAFCQLDVRDLLHTNRLVQCACPVWRCMSAHSVEPCMVSLQ